MTKILVSISEPTNIMLSNTSKELKMSKSRLVENAVLLYLESERIRKIKKIITEK